MIIGDKVKVIAKIDNQGYVGVVINVIPPKTVQGQLLGKIEKVDEFNTALKNQGCDENAKNRYKVKFEILCTVCGHVKETWCVYKYDEISHITEEEYNTKISNNVINMEDYNK